MPNAQIQLSSERHIEARSAPDGFYHPAHVEAGFAVAPTVGAAQFRITSAVPKAAELTAIQLTLEATAPAVITVGSVDLGRVTRGQPVTIDIPVDTAGLRDELADEELTMREFDRLVVEVKVEADREPAKLKVGGTIDYTLPEESAAAYMTYIMTQA